MICYSCLEIIPSGTTPIPLIFPNFLYTPKLLTLFLKYALFDRTVKPQGPVAGSVFFCRIWYYKHKRLQRKCDILTCCQGKILASPVLLCYTTFIVCGSGVSCCNSIMKSKPRFHNNIEQGGVSTWHMFAKSATKASSLATTSATPI